MEIILFAVVVILSAWIIKRRNSREFFKLANNVPSRRWHTILGCGKLMRPKDVLSNMYEFGEKYGPNSVFWLGPYPLFLTSDPETLREILTSRNCIDKPEEFYNGVASIAGQGLITESEPIWSQHRRLLNKSFSNKNLLSFLPAFHAEIDQFIQTLGRIVDKEEPFNILVMLRVLSLNNATRTTLKRNLEATNFNSTSMSKHFEQILQFASDICLYNILTIKWVNKFVSTHIYKNAAEGIAMFLKLINESLNMAQRGNVTDSSFLSKDYSIIDCILEKSNQNAIKPADIPGLLTQVFVGAFETTSTTLFFALSLLAMHPEYQERAHEEAIKILAENHDELTMDQLDQLVYLEMIFNETMRVLPIIPMVFRKVSNEDFTLSNNLTLPVGQIIAIDIFRLHRNKDLWGADAEDFNPDNFLPSNVARRHPYSFIPFTKGQRFCIGWRYGTLFSKLALAKLIVAFKFSTDFKYKNLRFENHISLKMIEEPRIQVERRGP